MSAGVDTAPVGPQVEDAMSDPRAALRQALEATPTSIRALAREAGVSHRLLRLVRDGERRLTPETRDAVADALRRWAEDCRGGAEALERCDLEPGADDA